MKKLLTILLVAMLALGIIACGQATEDDGDKTVMVPATRPSEPEETTPIYVRPGEDEEESEENEDGNTGNSQPSQGDDDNQENNNEVVTPGGDEETGGETGGNPSIDVIGDPLGSATKLTWEKINSFAVKTGDMSVADMRQLCLEFMIFNKTYLWTPSEQVDFIRNNSGTFDTMYKGTVYGGLPYVGVASGNPYRMMDYIDENGVVDMQKAIPALGSGERLAMSDLKYFGSQCSIAVYWAWGRVINSAKYAWTYDVVPCNDFIILGNVNIPSTLTRWTTTYGTDECVKENGEQALFSGYAQLQKADGMVYFTTAGHLIMAYSDPVVVYDEDGTIDGDASYIYIIDQGQTWEDAISEEGDSYQYKGSVAAKKTFKQLFNANYIPFTFKEFQGTDDIEVTEVSLKKGNTTYISGTISESDRSFEATTTTNQLTWKQFMSAKVDSNYGVVDVYLLVYDNDGNEIYKHAVRTGSAGDLSLDMKEAGAMVTTWENGELESGETYKAKIVVQLSTGERPTIFLGQLTMN